MPYVGNTPSTSFATVVKDSFSGDGSTVAFTLSKVATTNSVSVFVENVRQEPTTAYAVSGTTLTFTAAPVTSSGNNIYVLHMNPTTTTTHPSAQNLTAVNGTLTGTLAVTGTSTLTGNVTASADVSVGDDLSLASDGAVLGFGADNEITLTHVHNTGLRIEDEDILYFGTDQDLSIQHTNSSNLQIIDASARLLIRAPRIDVQNGDGSETLFLGIDGGAFYAYHNNTQALETTSGGGVTVANGLTLTDGDVTVASGHGINFAATSDASGMASELLDDYEEGTFDLTAHNANLTLEDSSSYGVGRYVKVGRLVTVTCSARVSSVSSTNAVFFTMPFTAQADPTGGQNESSGSGFFSGPNIGDAGLAWYWAGGSNLVTFYKNNDDAGGAQLLNSDLAANDEMYFTATCIANS